MSDRQMPDPSAGYCSQTTKLQQWVDGGWHWFIVVCNRKLGHIGRHAFRWKETNG